MEQEKGGRSLVGPAPHSAREMSPTHQGPFCPCPTPAPQDKVYSQNFYKTILDNQVFPDHSSSLMTLPQNKHENFARPIPTFNGFCDFNGILKVFNRFFSKIMLSGHLVSEAI